MNEDESIYTHESPTVSTELIADGPSLVLELTTGGAGGKGGVTTIRTVLSAGDVGELWDALDDWLNR